MTNIDASTKDTKRYVGVDANELGNQYHAVLETSLRADPDILVICTPSPDQHEFDYIRRASLVGRLVYLATLREQAPKQTQWLTKPIG
jgi:type II secretory ATPase GspE/PulE/Tfp pilus assembly ATPase PilB-like protein